MAERPSADEDGDYAALVRGLLDDLCWHLHHAPGAAARRPARRPAPHAGTGCAARVTHHADGPHGRRTRPPSALARRRGAADRHLLRRAPHPTTSPTSRSAATSSPITSWA